MTWLFWAVIGLALLILLRCKSDTVPETALDQAVAEDEISDEILAVIMSAIAEEESEDGDVSPAELLAIIAAAVDEYENSDMAA